MLIVKPKKTKILIKTKNWIAILIENIEIQISEQSPTRPRDATVRLIDTATYAQSLVLEGHTGPVRALHAIDTAGVPFPPNSLSGHVSLRYCGFEKSIISVTE